VCYLLIEIDFKSLAIRACTLLFFVFISKCPEAELLQVIVKKTKLLLNYQKFFIIQ
jgi:hypothetical protein